MPRPTGHWLWFNQSDIPYDTWDSLAGEVKLKYGLPQLIASVIGWFFNSTMFLTCRQRVTKDIRDTFFFWTLMLLMFLNMIQLVNHLLCAFMTLAMDYEIYVTILTIGLARAGCYCSDLLRGIIAVHRLIVVLFPFQLHSIPRAVYACTLLCIIGLFFSVLGMYMTPGGAFVFWANEVFFETFTDESLQFDINHNLSRLTNYTNLVAGAVSYGILVPVVLYRSRTTEPPRNKGQNFALPLFVTFLCSIATFVLWEVMPPVYVHNIKDPELRRERRIAFAGHAMLSQLLWILQNSQESAVLFLFNQGLRKDMLRNLICNALEEKTEKPTKIIVQTKRV